MGYMKSDHIFALAYFAMLYNVRDMKTLSSNYLNSELKGEICGI